MFSKSSKTGSYIKLYRYLSRDGLLKTLSNLSLKFSRPSLFNDPYDNHIPVTNKCDESLLKSNIKMSILNYFSKDGSLKSNSFFYKNLALFFARNPTVLAEIQNQMSIPCHNCNELNNLVDFVFSNYKNNNNVMYFDHKRPSEKDIICCFSRCKDSLLMWAHYADNHKGGVIEFELPCDYADGWHEVNYI